MNAIELSSEMRESSEFVLIIPSGVFPETIHSKNESLVGSWLGSGGTMIWIGDAFGRFSGLKGGRTELFSEGDFGSVQNQILGFSFFNETSGESERFATQPSDFSTALDLAYPETFVGAYVSEVIRQKGVVLGRTTSSSNPRSSIAQFPVGNGCLLLFGGGVRRAFTASGEDVIARDIAHILSFGFPLATEEVVYNTHHLATNEELNGTIQIVLPEDRNVEGILVAAYSKAMYVRFFSRHFIPTSRSDS